MNKTSIKFAALAAAAVLGLAGCGSSPAKTSAPVASVGAAADVAVLQSIVWGADASGAPTLKFVAPATLTAAASRLIKEGDGAAIAAGDAVSFDAVVTSGVDSSVLYSTYTSGGTPEGVFLSATSLDPVFYSAFVGHKVGANLIYGTLSTDPTGATTNKVPIFVAITIKSSSVPLARATGAAVAPVAGLPVVTLTDKGVPSVTMPSTAAPTNLVSQVLITGSGAQVSEGQTIVAHYTGYLWNGTKFDSSWDNGAPSSFPLVSGSVIDGWIQGLPGKTVGSQVLLVVPPSLGYGDTANGSIPASSTLVFVVDILAAT